MASGFATLKPPGALPEAGFLLLLDVPLVFSVYSR